MNDRVIINFATDAYKNGRERLNETVNDIGVDKLFWTKEEEIGSPLHHDNPYAFKIYAFKKAIELGYKKILWLDASVYAIKETYPIWDIIEKEGYLIQSAGHIVGHWANDNCISYFGITRDEAMKMIMHGNAGFLGLNMDFDISKEFFSQWEQSMLDGVFKGGWRNDDKSESQDERCRGHRHDMTCGSIIANKLGMERKSAEELLEYASPEKPVKNDTIVFKAEGIN